MGALGRELISRGHQVTLLHMEDVGSQVRKEGLQFVAIGQQDHPAGSLPISLAALGKLDGVRALRFTVQAVRKTTEMFCRDAPNVLRGEQIGMLLVDQTEPAGGTIAEHLGIPFVSIANALALNEEDGVPPAFADWAYRPGILAKLRNRAGFRAGHWVLRPVWKVVAQYRRSWKLKPIANPNESFSKLTQICQLPREFDYPRTKLPPTFHYTGPLRRAQVTETAFPWDRLDGRPLIYASLGTLQNARQDVFRCFGEACQGLPAQLVISHGGGLDEKAAASLAHLALVVPYAPQLDLLKRAALTVTHAGLNTVLDTLTNGVPAVAIPITYEQPSIAARLLWSGAGAVLPFSRLTAGRLRIQIQAVFREERYRENAKRIAQSIQESGGVTTAADRIEALL